MTQRRLTPWSQLDDDVDENDGIAVSSEDRAQQLDGLEDAPGVPDPGPTAGLGRRCFIKVAPHWAVVPLAAASLWLAASAIRAAGRETGIPTSHALGILGLILVGITMVIASRIVRRAALAGIHRTISGNTPASATADRTRTQQVFGDLPITEDLQPLWEAVRGHTTRIEERVADVLEQHRQLSLELSLADMQKRHANLILNSIPDPVLVTDAFDQLVLANAAAENLFAFKSAEALRQPIAGVITDETLVAMIRQAREADSRAASRRLEHTIGSRFYALTMSPLNAGPPPDETHSQDHGIVILLRDVTKEREATRMKSEFVARVAHELRTPLSSIRAYVEMLVDGEAADEKTREAYYNIIQASADRLGRMIDNMLNISRIEAGTVRIKKEPVAVSMIVNEAADMVRPQAEEKAVTLSEELSPVAFRIMADRDMIHQAILNLLSNAIKYTPHGGKVHVRMTPHEENRTIRIEVSDTGVGIPKEDLPKVFEKFFRVEANKEMAKGTGLGLNLAKHIVETIHEGKMTLKSERGKGSTFGIVLPLMS